jgi:hypothetical protein
MECDTFRASTGVYEKGINQVKARIATGSELCWYQKFTDMLLDNARIIRKESLEIRHNCRNTMCISRMLRSILQEEKQSRPSLRLARSSIPIIRRGARHDNAPKLVSMSPRFIRAQGLGFVR